MDSLAQITHLILDMDGVLYRGSEPMPRLGEFFAFLRERRIPFMLVTNNATRTPQERSEKLAAMGAEVSPSEILTSAQAAARLLRRDYPQGTRVHVFGMPALRQAMAEEGFVLADERREGRRRERGPRSHFRKGQGRLPAHPGRGAFHRDQPRPQHPVGGRLSARDRRDGRDACGRLRASRRPASASPSRSCTNSQWPRWAPGPRRPPPWATA